MIRDREIINTMFCIQKGQAQVVSNSGQILRILPVTFFFNHFFSIIIHSPFFFLFHFKFKMVYYFFSI